MSNLKTKAFALLVAAALVSGGSAAHAASLTQAQINAIISLLQSFGADAATVSSVNSALSGAPVAAPVTSGSCSFTGDLTMGSQGDDVKCLQNYLIGTDHFTFSGGATGYFGSVTKSAVSAWQAANGVSPAAGYFGSVSRAKYSSLTGVSVTTPTTPTTPTTLTTIVTGTGLAVEAGVQPNASLAPDNATRIPFTVVKFTAGASDVTVDSLVIERTGLANDAVFSGIVLLDEKGVQLGVAKTLNSLHQTTLTEDFVVKAGQSRIMTIGANRADTATYAGQIAYLNLVSVNTVGGAVVSGVLPISGAGHTINESLSIGSVTMLRGATDPSSNQSKEVGITGYTFSAIRVTAGSAEKVYLESVRWYQSGSAAKGDLANIKVIADGKEYDPVVSSDGKYYTASFGNGAAGILIDKGFSKDVSIKGDVSGGSARTIAFDIAKRTDVGLKGETYGYGLIPPQTTSCASPTTSGTACFTSTEDPWYDSAIVTISAGTMTVSNSTSVASQNISINQANQVLGAVSVDVRGEPITVGAMDFNVTLGSEGTDMDVNDITSVSLYDENGAVIAGPVDGSATPDTTGASSIGGDGVITFTDTVTFPTGVHIYTLKGKVGTDITNNITIIASTTPNGQWTTVTGQTTGVTITPSPSSALTLSQMTVKSNALTVSVSTVPIAQTVIAGSNQFLFANYIMDSTASGEDVRLTTIIVAYDVVTAAATELTSCTLYDGSTAVTTGSNVKNPAESSSSTSFTFDGSGLVIPKGTSKTISLKCNVASSISAGDIFRWGINNGESYTGATGVTSGQTVVEVFTDSIGQNMTGATGGALAVTLDSDSPGYAIVAAGTTGVTLAKIRFAASNEDINLKQIALEMTSAASNTPIDLVGRKVTLWDGSTQVGEAVFPTGDNATSSAITNFTITRDGAKVLTIKGDIAAITNSGPLTNSGDLLIVGYDGDNVGLNGTYGTGVASGNTVNGGTTDRNPSGVRIMKAYPTLAKISVPSNAITAGAQSGKSLYRFSVKANNGDVALYKWTFTIGSSSVQATTSTYGLYVFTDSGLSGADTAFTSDGLINYGNCVNGRNDVTSVSRVPNADDSPTEVQIYPDKGTTACNATTTYVVPSGVTRYFELRGTVANVEGATGVETISVTMDGDAAYPANLTGGDNTTGNMFSASTTDRAANDDFIWSPISTTSANTMNDFDFTNGYSVVGLPGTTMTIEYFTSPN